MTTPYARATAAKTDQNQTTDSRTLYSDGRTGSVPVRYQTCAAVHRGSTVRCRTCAYTPENYERELTAMIRQAAELEIPLIAAGGIYDRRDLEHCLYLGAAGVQMGTRFVTTEECDAADAYKQAYLSARKEDIVIVKSPVGMPGRAIQNAFLEKVAAGERFMTGCRHCIKTCDPKTAPYCITRALINAAMGDVDNGLLFCGSNAWRAQKIERTVDIMEEMA